MWWSRATVLDARAVVFDRDNGVLLTRPKPGSPWECVGGPVGNKHVVQACAKTVVAASIHQLNLDIEVLTPTPFYEHRGAENKRAITAFVIALAVEPALEISSAVANLVEAGWFSALNLPTDITPATEAALEAFHATGYIRLTDTPREPVVVSKLTAV